MPVSQITTIAPDNNPVPDVISPAEELSRTFEQNRIKSKVIRIEGNTEFPEAIIFDMEKDPNEKLTRIYRGVNHLDESILQQIPYAMRTKDGHGEIIALEEVRHEVETLALNPTYENLITYVNKVRHLLKPAEVEQLEKDLIAIEEGILEGHSTRIELIMRQIEHCGGFGEYGISPYISASFSPHDAVTYGRAGLIIIDTPLSQIEYLQPDSTEINIKGALTHQHITAILPRGNKGERTQTELQRAIHKVNEVTPIKPRDQKELLIEKEKRLAFDKIQWEQDVVKVREKRVNDLKKCFPDVDLNQLTVEQDVDIYTATKRAIFDFYSERLRKAKGNNTKVEEYEYEESPYGRYINFDRSNIDDTMLKQLKNLVVRIEERQFY